MNKTISINPDLFTLHSKGTRKRTSKPKEIKLKVPKEHNDTLSKRNLLLKFIRRHQEKNSKKQLDDEIQTEKTEPVNTGDFDESLKYLMDTTDEFEKKKTYNADKSQNNPNYTLKRQNKGSIDENVSMIFPGSEHNLIPVVLPPVFHSSLPRMQLAAPKYGCLKNGRLPTFRQFHRGQQTQKNIENNFQGGGLGIIEPLEISKNDTLENELHSDKSRNNDSLRYPNKKKILRRTFRLGKSIKHRRVSVLVSNKTLRHQVSNKNQLLKQTPIIDVKRYLVKHGLIKVGSIAPPEILRKMYESASLMCGEVKNHNSEILLYNYMNGNNKRW